MDESKLKSLVSSAFEDATGMKREDFDNMRREHEALRAREVEINRQYTKDLAHENMNKAYEHKARNVIKSDKYGGAGLKLGRVLRAYGVAANMRCAPEEIAKRWGDGWLADTIVNTREKALASGVLASGGALVPSDELSEMIELLRAESVVRAAGARQLPMPHGNLSMPKQTGAATAAYVGENLNTPSSQPSFGTVQLVGHKLVSIVPASNELLRESDPRADQIVRDDLLATMSLKEDEQFLKGTGGGNTPLGLLYQISAANQFAREQAAAVSTYSEIVADLFRAAATIAGDNVKLRSPAWFMNSRTQYHLMSLHEAGLYPFKEEMSRGRLINFPYFVSNQITNTESGLDETLVFLVEMSEVLIGDAQELEIQVFPGGTYYNGVDLTSGISTDQTVFQATSKHDIALRHAEAGAVINTVDWGAP